MLSVLIDLVRVAMQGENVHICVVEDEARLARDALTQNKQASYFLARPQVCSALLRGCGSSCRSGVADPSSQPP